MNGSGSARPLGVLNQPLDLERVLRPVGVEHRVDLGTQTAICAAHAVEVASALTFRQLERTLERCVEARPPVRIPGRGHELLWLIARTGPKDGHPSSTESRLKRSLVRTAGERKTRSAVQPGADGVPVHRVDERAVDHAPAPDRAPGVGPQAARERANHHDLRRRSRQRGVEIGPVGADQGAARCRAPLPSGGSARTACWPCRRSRTAHAASSGDSAARIPSTSCELALGLADRLVFRTAGPQLFFVGRFDLRIALLHVRQELGALRPHQRGALLPVRPTRGAAGRRLPLANSATCFAYASRRFS